MIKNGKVIMCSRAFISKALAPVVLKEGFDSMAWRTENHIVDVTDTYQYDPLMNLEFDTVESADTFYEKFSN